MSDEQPKVIIDEDWKTQVQREKEEAAKKTPEPQPGQDAEAGDVQGEAEAEAASFSTLVASLATQTMFSLGMIAQRGQDRVTVNLDDAKFTIDLLVILREKTKGNLSKEEEGALQEAISDLQRVYVARAQQVQEQVMREAGVDLSALRPK